MPMRPVGLPEIPEQTVMVARAAFSKGSLAIRVRDRLAEVFASLTSSDNRLALPRPLWGEANVRTWHLGGAMHRSERR